MTYKHLIRLITISLMVLLISLILMGCTTTNRTTQLNSSIFDNVTIYEKPMTAKGIQDIQKAYIRLFHAYKNNLEVIQTIQEINKKKP